MTPKAYLSQAIWLDQRIESKLEQLETLKSLTMKITSNLTKDKVKCSTDVSQMENLIVKVMDFESDINADISVLIDLKKEIQECINRIEDFNQQLLLELRYLCNKGWDDIAISMGYDRRTVFRIHGKALKSFEKCKSCH